MRIRYISDIHLELIETKIFVNVIQGMKNKDDLCDICILAGDIGNPYKQNYKDFMETVNNNFKKIFVIAGNHEYYNNNIIETKNYMTELFKNYKNISFLDNSYGRILQIQLIK